MLKRDPSRKNMTKFYTSLVSIVLVSMITAVGIGRYSGSHALPNQRYWLTEEPTIIEMDLPEGVEIDTEESTLDETDIDSTSENKNSEKDSVKIYTGLLVYSIKWGDTLWETSKKTGFSIQEIADFNLIEDPNLIYTREFLVFPVGLERDIVVDSLDSVVQVLNGNLEVEQLTGDDMRERVNKYIPVSDYRNWLIHIQMNEMGITFDDDVDTIITDDTKYDDSQTNKNEGDIR